MQQIPKIDWQKMNEVLSQVLQKISKPVSTLDLYKDYIEFVSLEKVDDQSSEKVYLTRFLFSLVKKFLVEINYGFLSEVSERVYFSIMKLKEFSYENFKLCEDPSYKDVNRVVSNIFVELQEIQRWKEECFHYTGINKHAINYLNNLNKAIQQLVLNPDVGEDIFKSIKDRERVSSQYVSDIISLMGSLKSLNGLLSNSLEILNGRYNMLMRIESSVRMLTRTLDSEFKINEGQSKPKTNGFKIEQI